MNQYSVQYKKSATVRNMEIVTGVTASVAYSVLNISSLIAPMCQI